MFNKKHAIYFGLPIVFTLHLFTVGRDSSVGIAIRYGLNGPRIESGGGEIFRTLDRHWGPPGLLYNGYRCFSGVNRPERGSDHPPHLAPKLKKEYSYTSTTLLGLRGLL